MPFTNSPAKTQVRNRAKAVVVVLAILAGMWLGVQPGQASRAEDPGTAPNRPVPTVSEEFARYLEPVGEGTSTMVMGGGGTPLHFD